MNSVPPVSSGLQADVRAILDAAIAGTAAAKGNIQLLDADREALRIVAQRGFDADFLHLFERVRWDDASICGRAWRLGRRVVVSDIRADPRFRPYLSVCRANGFLAVQSTPVCLDNGEVVGMLSTHFADVRELSADDETILDACARRLLDRLRKAGDVPSS